MSADALSNAPLSRIRQVFEVLEPVPTHMRAGTFRASFIGPGWLRATAGPSIALSGMPGWWGKRFLDAETATNVLNAAGGRIEKLQMRCGQVVSLVDGRESVALQYDKDAVVPWRWIIDELRVLDDSTLLGMTVINLPLLRGLAFPFLLRREA